MKESCLRIYKKMAGSLAVSIISIAALFLALGGGLWAYFGLEGAASPGFAPGASGRTPLILHFNDIQGINSVGGVGTIVFMAVFGVVAALLNFWIALELDQRDGFLGKFAASMTLVVAVLLFIAFAAIISVN